MNMNKEICFIIFVLAGVATACILAMVQPVSSSVNEGESGTNFKSYMNDTFGFSINYPSNWFVNRPEQLYLDMKTTVSFESDNESDYSSDPHIDVAKWDIPERGMTLEKYSTEEVKSLSEFEVIEGRSFTTLSGQPAYMVVLSALPDSDSDRIITMVWTIKDGSVYQVAYYASEAAYPIYYPLYQKMLDSFRFTK